MAATTLKSFAGSSRVEGTKYALRLRQTFVDRQRPLPNAYGYEIAVVSPDFLQVLDVTSHAPLTYTKN
jgi:hypothetical protein